MAGDVYLADTSTWVLREQFDSVRERFDALLLSGRLATCQIIRMEFLNVAPDPNAYKALRKIVTGHRWMDVTTTAMSRATEVHEKLASLSQHRNFNLPDLIIAATAEQHGATVLHYDADYDRIAAITKQPVEWVVPKGSL